VTKLTGRLRIGSVIPLTSIGLFGTSPLNSTSILSISSCWRLAAIMRLNCACRSSTEVCAGVEIRGRRGRCAFGSGTSPRLGSIIESIVGVRAPYCERVDSVASSLGVSSLLGTMVGPDGPAAFSSSSDIREAARRALP